jgi:cytidylate kinase
MIITIDGPAGAGKSTVARELARRLGFRFLDTGAMYRAVTLAGLRKGIDWTNPDELAQVAENISLQLQEERVFLDGQDVSEAIRAWEITRLTRHAADNPRVRARLVALQRAFAQGQNIVTEGRDQGTLVFPDAECKFFLTASAEERARRRWAQLQSQGENATWAEVLAAQQKRDQEDAARPFGSLVAAADAIPVNTDGLSVSECVNRLEHLFRQRTGWPPPIAGAGGK